MPRLAPTYQSSETPARPTVLVVDDDLDVQRIVARGVERAGFRAVCTIDGREGLRLYDELRPVMVCLDLMLPNLSGFEICRRLRAAGSKVPVAAISARDLPEDVAHALEAGFDTFVSKPVRAEEVARTLSELFRQIPAAAG